MLDNNYVLIAEFPVMETTQEALVDLILSRISNKKKSILFFANTNFIVKCRPIVKRMFNNDLLIVNDGLGMDIASLMLYRKMFKSNLNGTDFVPFLFSNIFKKTNKSLNIYLLGGKAEVLNQAAYFMVHELGHIVVGSCDGYDGIKNTSNLVGIINDLKADVVLVALGNAQQEEWILNYYQQLNALLVAGVGGLFDFLAGDKPRAPMWIRELRMEWFYRLCIEPKRLYKRYSIDVLKFLAICLRYRKRLVK